MTRFELRSSGVRSDHSVSFPTSWLSGASCFVDYHSISMVFIEIRIEGEPVDPRILWRNFYSAHLSFQSFGPALYLSLSRWKGFFDDSLMLRAVQSALYQFSGEKYFSFSREVEGQCKNIQIGRGKLSEQLPKRGMEEPKMQKVQK